MPSKLYLESETPIAVTMTSLRGLVTSTTSGGAQSAKVDLGASRPELMLLRLQTAFTTAPVAGGALECYIGFSSQSTATSGNVANLSGSDAAWTGYGNDVNNAKRHLQFVGVMSVCVTTSTTVPQVCDVGTFIPMDRYASVVVVNTTSQPTSTSTTLTAVTIYPVAAEAQ